MKRPGWVQSVVAAAALALTIPVSAQQLTGIITGRVQDAARYPAHLQALVGR